MATERISCGFCGEEIGFTPLDEHLETCKWMKVFDHVLKTWSCNLNTSTRGY